MKEFSPTHLNVRVFAEADGTLSGRDALASFPRLVAEAVDAADGVLVEWQVNAEERRVGVAGETVPWLHLLAQTMLPLTCQRCLAPVPIHLQVDRWFRFVANETIAAAEDEEAEEDVLVASRDFNLMELIEDELLMAVPVNASHEVCPQPVPMTAADPNFEDAQQERAKPFAVLASLKGRKSK